MHVRFINCLKAWGAGMVILGFPLVFLYPAFTIGSELWRISILLFVSYYPAILLFEFIFKKYIYISFMWRISELVFLFVLSELEIYLIPLEYSQVIVNLGLPLILTMFVFKIAAAIVVVLIVRKKKNLVIVQKEI